MDHLPKIRSEVHQILRLHGDRGLLTGARESGGSLYHLHVLHLNRDG